MSQLLTVTDCPHYTLIAMDDGKANALGFDMLKALDKALDEAEAAVKTVVIVGRPGKFCAGFDLTVMGKGGPDQARLLRAGAELSLRLVRFPLPVVLGVTGHALAMGALVCLSADYRIGVEGSFKLGLNEVAIGMTLPWFGIELARDRLSGTHINPAVGLAKLCDPEAAVSVGYLDEVVDPEVLMVAIDTLTVGISHLDLKAHAATKLRVRAPLLAALESAVEKDFGSAQQAL